MDLVRFTRQLVDIDSTTGSEGAAGEHLARELAALDYNVEEMPVEPGRFNVYAVPRGGPVPQLVFSTHMDTVPPFIASSEDEEKIYGRGSCDAKGIIAAQIAAAQRLRADGFPLGLLFLVGEERDSLGAKIANPRSPGCRYLLNGEPTGNKMATASKGALRVEIVAQGRMAHSAYPELGESAIDKLLDALARLRSMPLPTSPEVGPCTMNIGMITGGRAPNVIPDCARAHLLYRLVGPADDLRKRIVMTAGDRVHTDFVLEIPFVRLRTVDGIPTTVVAFTTDIPALSNWGEPMLLGPGSIHVAHTDGEFVEKKHLHEAIEMYCSIAKKLLSR